jgi:superfamily II DNA/RNA helicase
MEAFHTGRVEVLVATDIAARGIHVDDVALVIHADPPSEHKAYLHRSGRTARAGASGTVVTLATREQLREVKALTRNAGITASTTRVEGPSHPALTQLAPGERVLSTLREPVPSTVPVETAPSTPRRRRNRRTGRPQTTRPAASAPRGSHSAAGFSAGRR